MAQIHTVIRQSDYPNMVADPGRTSGWRTTEEVCPNCLTVHMWSAPWRDEALRIIGTKYICGDCSTVIYNDLIN